MPRDERRKRSAGLGPLLAGSLLSLCSSGRVQAYEAATTLAGLTQQAALASRLHRRLLDRFGLSLGLFDPVRLDLSRLPEREARALRLRFLALDPAEGYAPTEEPVGGKIGPLQVTERQTALSWLMAGSVIESVPAFWVRNQFLDPKTLTGLHRPRGQSAAAASMQAMNHGLATFRELLTGAAFDGNGEPAVTWMSDPRNELGLPTFLRAAEQAVAGEHPADRETALSQMLLSAGAILSLLEQMGDPAHVRNDFEQALLLEGGRYERFVASRYGRAGIPSAAAPEGDGSDPAAPAHLRDLFVAPAGPAAGSGLAERTATRFLSPGTLPSPAARFPLPAGAWFQSSETPESPYGDERLNPGLSGYVGTKDVPHLAAWFRVPHGPGKRGELRYLVDNRCHADYAAALLPEIGRYARRALDLLFRGDLTVSLDQGQVQVRAGELGFGAGTVVLLGEGADRRRRRLSTQPSGPTDAGAMVASLAVPEEGRGLKRVVVLFTGQDAGGEPLVASATLDLPEAAQD